MEKKIITEDVDTLLFDDEEHVLQFGNPDELSEEQVEIVESETNTYSVPTTKCY